MIYKICVTGGPCGGKTSALKHLKAYLQTKGFNVLTVHQLPTILVQSGAMIKCSQFTKQQLFQFQTRLVQARIYNQTHMQEIAKMFGSDTIIFCDRGAFDFTAYVDQETTQAIFDQKGWNTAILRDQRYHAVLYFASVASGAQQFYSLSNNAARHESLQESKQLDKRTLKAYMNHPNFFYINNKVLGFQQKVKNAIARIDEYLSDRKKPSIIYEIDKVNLPQSAISMTVKVKYRVLKGTSKNSIRYVVARGNQNFVYYEKNKHYNQDSDQIKVGEKPILPSKYLQLLEEADPAFKPVEKERTSVVLDFQHFLIDRIPSTGKQYVILEDKQKIPPESVIKISKQLNAHQFYISLLSLQQ